MSRAPNFRETTFLLPFLGVAFLALSPMPSGCEEYLPLSIGNYWVYDGSYFGEHERAHVSGTIRLWDTDVSVVSITESTHNEGLENYWTTASDGDVSLWGFRRWDGYGMVYSPPGVVLDAPLYVGKRWTTTITVYSTPDTIPLGQETWTFEVYTEETLELPAGSFHAFGIGGILPVPRVHPSLEGRGPSGEIITLPQLRIPSRWYCEGVGRVQYSTSDMYQLSAHGNEPSATQATSWGRVKSLYRCDQLRRP